MRTQFTEQHGYGKMKFVLGHGADGTAGHVELLLQTLPNPGRFSVEWRVTGNNFAADARERIENAASSYLQGYLAVHSEFGLSVAVLAVTSDESRQNDYERAIYWAMHSALQEAKLPLPQIYAAPDEDDTWENP